MHSPVKILVTGATGKQGGAVINALLSQSESSPQTVQLFALTRNSSSTSAKALAARGITLVSGSLASRPDAILDLTGRLDAVFLVTVPDSKHPELEDKQAIAFIGAAIQHGVKHLVFSSVDRGGPEMSLENPTPVPHFASKQRIEKALLAQTKNGATMTWTILRPTTFYENLTPNTMGKGFASMWREMVSHRMQMVSCKDIGVVGARALVQPERYAGSAISLAGDEINLVEASRVFEKVVDRKMPVAPSLVGTLLKRFINELGIMFRWFVTDGYGVDVEGLAREEGKMLNFEGWLSEQSQFVSTGKR